jgi:hypothetical protein
MDEENKDVVSLNVFGNEQIQFDVDDVIPDPSNIIKSFTGIAWAIKHGHALTNVSHLENPLISIQELTKVKRDQMKPV